MKRFAFSFLLLTFFVVSGCVSAGHDPALTAQLDEVLGSLSDTGAVYTARVVELSTGRELYAHDIDVPFTPASNMKIPVTAAGLDLFGTQHTFKTYLAKEGGDLWIIGTGDPGTGDPRLAKLKGGNTVTMLDQWADKLIQHHIGTVGDIYYYEGALDNQLVHDSWGESVLHWYGAPVSGLNFNDNCVDITITPTFSGKPVSYTVMPPVSCITVNNKCITKRPRCRPAIIKLPDGNVYEIDGGCRIKTELKSKPVDNPGEFFADAFKTHLEKRGIKVTGRLKSADAPLGRAIPPDRSKVIAVHETSMINVLSRINTNSQNLFAECLSKLNGQAFMARQGKKVPGSWTDGEKAIRAFLKKSNIDDSQFVLADGSGLSHLNKVTARMITDIFATMYKRADAKVYRDSLANPVSGGSLHGRMKDLEGHVFVKTGLINGVRALSGYVKTKKGKWLTFSIIYNRIPGSVKPFEGLQDNACRILTDWE